MLQWILSLILSLISWGNPSAASINETGTVSPTPVQSNWVILYKKIEYGYTFVNNINPRSMELINNLKKDKFTASELNLKFGCVSGINGGFYDTSFKPIGLFIENEVVISKTKESRIFNGFISINKLYKLNISDTFSENSLYAMQTGPLLLFDNQPRKLSINNDKPARRMIMAENVEGKAVFLSIFLPNAELLGPILSDLPEILHEISKTEKLNLKNAINLDGGSASALISKEKILSEQETIGSWWCVHVE